MLWIAIIFAACVFLCAIFSGSESALYGLSPVRLRYRRDRGEREARILWGLRAHPEAVVAAMLVGTNACDYLATYLFTEATHSEVLATLIVTPPIFLLGELYPKALFYRHADRICYRVAGFMRAWVLAMRILLVIPVLCGLARLLRRALGAKGEGRVETLSRRGLAEILGSSSPQMTHAHRQLALAALNLGQAKVGGFLVPLDKVVRVAPEDPVRVALDAVRRSGRSRIPVLDASGAPLGLVHFFEAAACPPETPCREAMRPAVALRPDESCNAAFQRLRRERQILGAVVDDRGKAIGIVSVEDLAKAVL